MGHTANLSAPPTVTTYLFFAGRCEEAIDFYQQALGATVVSKLRWSDSPDPHACASVADDWKDKIMHVSFNVGETLVMGSDGSGSPAEKSAGFEGFRLTLTLASKSDCSAVFDALSAEGTVDVPLAESFFSPMFGMVTDKFGVAWMVMMQGEVS
ncbi:VOC family protein [Stieleria sp. JC731]|uniref:VOC family protein n=1 Tax=Pirellulaceae TaxID=2691357 RepID=UPI001E427E34|nr:VOC family protein [Stieleria sp. JC731]MCC9601945.1 VOC family protein [Stieleria sp. JC731]